MPKLWQTITLGSCLQGYSAMNGVSRLEFNDLTLSRRRTLVYLPRTKQTKLS